MRKVHPTAAALTCAAWVAGLVLLACATAAAAAGPADEPALEKQLADARQRLDVAARDVARLSAELYGDDMEEVARMVHRGRPGAMLGVNVGRSEGRSEGVEVAGVSPGGPAERAGLRVGDVIVAVDGQSLKASGERSASAQLVAFMRGVEPGQTVRVEYLRDGKRQSAAVKAGPAGPALAHLMRDRMPVMPPMEGMPFAGFHDLLRPGRALGSLELVPITPKLGRYFGTDRGLLVVRAPADRGLALEEGDVLLSVAGRTPDSPGQAFRILQSYEPGEKVKLSIVRNHKPLEVEAVVPGPVPPPKAAAVPVLPSASMRAPCCAPSFTTSSPST